MTSSEQIASILAFQEASEEQRIQHIDMMVGTMGERAFCQMAAGQLVSLTRPEKAMPESLVHFGPMARDGIAFFLSKISYPRLRKTILSQARFRPDSEIGERLLDLALHFPTLHKLGQIIARNPGLDPTLKGWLIQLEKGFYKTDTAKLVQQLTEWLAGVDPDLQVSLEPHILAEASVAAVLSFTYQKKHGEGRSKGVFKILKPEIEDYLLEELSLLKDVASFFENHREAYGLQEMMVVDLFSEVRDDLVREVDLAAEQKNLTEAGEIYRGVQGVRIPELFSFCTPTITSMEFLDGTRITDAEISQDQRKPLARLTFEAVICLPLFSIKESALFHGDPHAGNILVLPGKSSTEFSVALIDWTLAGHLTRVQRGHMVEMMVGIMSEDVWRICETIKLMIIQAGPDAAMIRIKECVTDFIASQDYQNDPLKKVFQLMAQVTMEGFVFPSELILFRKAFFTLEGVLADISPGFSMAEALESYLKGLLLAEIPLRITSGFLPIPDKATQYRTLLSNQALGELTFCQTVSTWHHVMNTNNKLIEIQTKMVADFLSCLWHP